MILKKLKSAQKEKITAVLFHWPLWLNADCVYMYRLSHIKFHRVIGRRRITIQPPPSGLVKFNM